MEKRDCKMSYDYIKKHWEKRCRDHGESHNVSIGDINAINLEVNAISNHIKDGDIVLDVGCANGFSTIKQFKLHELTKMYGVDNCEPMIDVAKNRNYKDIVFGVGNVLSLEFDDNYFDCTYTTRCLINLSNWKDQITAFNELYRVTKPGGKIIISEAFWEPLCKLNSLRLLFNLEPMVENDFNRYIKKEKFEKFLNGKKLRFYNEDFSSIYYIGSRVLREVFTDYTDYSNPINNIFFDLENEFSGGGAGLLQLYVINKEKNDDQ